MRDVARADDFSLHHPVGLVHFSHVKINLFPLEEREQELLGHRIVPVVLLEDLERVARGIAQDHGIRFEMDRRPVEFDFILALLEVERNRIADDREVLVVNRQPRRGQKHSG